MIVIMIMIDDADANDDALKVNWEDFSGRTGNCSHS